MVGKWYSYIQYLIQKADASLANVTNDSIIAKLLAKNGIVANYDDTLHSLQAIYEQLTTLTNAGVTQIAKTTIDLNQGTGAKDLFTGATQDTMLESLIIKMPTGDAGAPLTSISIQTDDATPAVLINSTDGDVSNLVSEAEIYWTGVAHITVGTKIQLTIAGGAHGSTYTCKVTAKYRSMTDGGVLS